MTSSSGQTFEALWNALSEAARQSCLGMVADRDCPALEVGRKLGLKVWQGKKLEAEAHVVERLRAAPDAVVLLCGYFAILSPAFLAACPAPVVNTHPSLLPAFPGLDKKVHAEAAGQVSVSGFSVHLVTDRLDGGPLVFQHPVFLEPGAEPDAVRESVRAAEQKWLPRVFERILDSDVRASDAQLSTFELRKKHSYGLTSFRELD
jgi:folate-dependent phosphoribosylglycinamide formyltransferase PurN